MSCINNVDDNNGALLFLMNLRDGNGSEDDDQLGVISFSGEGSDGNPHQFAQIKGSVIESQAGSETGRLKLMVAEYDGFPTTGLLLEGQDQDGEVDVTIGAGAASTTTIAGTLTMGSTAAMTNAGQLSVAAQPNITTMTGFLGGTANALITDDGDGTVTSESSLTYNTSFGTVLVMASTLPQINLNNTNNDANGGYLRLQNFRGASMSALGINDDLGQIFFSGGDAGGLLTNYASIKGDVKSSTATDEAGRLYLQAATSDGTTTALQTGILLTGDPTSNEVDVSIGYGASSLTTVNGNLLVEGVTQFNGQLEIGNASDTTLVRSSGGTLTVEGNTVATTNLALDSFADSTSNAIGVGTVELGHASDTTIARSAAGTVTIEGEQVFTTKVPDLTSGSAGVPAVIMHTRRTITTAEANSMHTTPIELVPAQGANTVIIPIGGMIRVDRAATQTKSAADLNIHYAGLAPGVYFSTSVAHQRRFMWNETGDRVFHITAMAAATEVAQNLTSDANKALQVSFDSETTTDCFTSIDIFLTYQVISIA